MLWTERQRFTLAGLLALIAVVLLVRLARNPAQIADPQAGEGPRARELVGRVDPNTADEVMLAALPVLGPAAAARIVAEREAWRAEHPGETPYTKPADLMRVRGIGVATTQAVEPYLIFPERDRPSTAD